MKYKKYGGKRFLWCGNKVGEFSDMGYCPKYNDACCPYHDNLMKDNMNNIGDYPYK